MEIAFDQALSAFQSTYAFLREYTRKNTALPWEKLEIQLQSSGLDRLHRQAILASLVDSVSLRAEHPVQLRILHMVEKDILSPEGYGVLLDGLRFGLVEVQHVESLLEELAGQENLPISAQALERTLARRWRYHLRKFAIH